VKTVGVLAAFIGMAHVVGCNALLGIDEATLDTSDASGKASGTGGAGGASSNGGAGGAGGATACSLTAPDPCNQCISQRCCDAYEACLVDADCKAGLSQYNLCVGVAFTNDAGETCDEDFATVSGRPLRLAFGTCAFANGAATPTPGCSEKCLGKPVGGDICSTYCACLADTCPEKSFVSGTCLENCGAFVENQLTCRPYHCSLARNAKTMSDEPGRQTHCGHSVGEVLCP